MTNNRRRLTGKVTKAKMSKTITVRIESSYRHPLYGKVMRSRKDYMVHDEIGCRPGDLVKIVESRPLSKRKRWVVEQIVRHTDKITLEADPEAPVVEDAMEAAE
jgi:small subunit ribosomal protein S17